MTQTKPTCILWLAIGLFLAGCSTVETENEVNTQELHPTPMVTQEPKPQVVEEPVVEVVVVEEPDAPTGEELVEEVIEIQPEPEVVEPDNLTILGFIKYVELEGGFFGIMTEDGNKYFPEYLEQDFKVDGLNVRVVAKPQEQILGIQMWGTPIEILKIEAN
ncbi:MAG: hypothetical protein O7C75_13720 [Verrucomicrobia bacterium]|nr:hypothetical protein [Verrucomicrobiota bacterium]